MAVPLTSADLPGTSTEAGGDIQVRSERPGRLAYNSAETSFQVADSRKRVRYTFVQIALEGRE